jgi:hypothetical protein
LVWRVTRTYPFAQGRSAKHAARGGGGGDDEARSGADGVLFRLHHYLFLDAYPLVLLRAHKRTKSIDDDDTKRKNRLYVSALPLWSPPSETWRV